MKNNPLTQITLPSGSVIEVKEWITGGQSQHAKDAFTERATVGADGKFVTDKVSGLAFTENKLRTAEAYVVSLDGQAIAPGEARAKVNDLTEEDYDFFFTKLDEHIQMQNKKKSSVQPQ